MVRPAYRLTSLLPATQLSVGRAEHYVHGQADERKDEHPDDPPCAGGRRQIRPAHDVDDGANPSYEEQSDSGDDEQADDQFQSLSVELIEAAERLLATAGNMAGPTSPTATKPLA